MQDSSIQASLELDNTFNRRFPMLHVWPARTGALATVNTWKADCLVSDIGMPGEDGYTLIKKVRALRKKNGGRIPAIALTGFAGIDDKSKAIAAGYQTHIPKPVDLGSLTSEIVRLVQKNRT